MRQSVFDYMLKTYGVAPDYPWSRYDSNAVFRHAENKKWFALVMSVPRCRLGLGGEGSVDVIDLKIDDPFFRDVIIREAGIMPGYHLNKQHWITVLLDGTVQAEQVQELIGMSFLATAPAKKKEKLRPAKEWIVPANPKYYDVEHAFDGTEEIDWKQGRGIAAGDTVFLYAAVPVSAILFQCRVTETDIPCGYADRNLTIPALMRLRLQKRYAPDRFPFSALKEEYGIFAVRGPRGIPYSLSAALKK